MYELDQPDRRIELIRARLEAYYDAESRGPRRVTWGGICDEIFDLTGVQMDDENLRQYVRRTMRRGQPRVPTDEHLEAIVSFLTHPDIDRLSREELEEPEIPFHSIRSLLEFLRHDEHSEISPPPHALGGVYHAIYRPSGLTRFDIELTFRVEKGDHVVRLSEVSEMHTGHSAMVFRKDFRGKPGRLEKRQQGEGWAILTPENNLFMFMKKKPYGHNYYYLTVAFNPSIWSDHSASQLALLRHEYPLERDPIPRSWEDLIKETEKDIVFLSFNKRQ
jgi:hypothetical protein